MRNPKYPSHGFVLFVALVWMTSFVSVQAANWAGGDGNWVSDNWGLDAPDGSPGDSNYSTTNASITAGGTISIVGGDSINLGTGGIVFMNNGQINQTGGSLDSTSRIDIRTSYTLSGGSLTGSGQRWVDNGGIYTISGGTFSTPNAFEFKTGVGTLVISAGSVTTGQVTMTDALITDATVRVVGSSITNLQSTTLMFNNSADLTSNSLLDVIFDSGGVTPWNVIGGAGSISLGSAGSNTAANLSVNVSARAGDGVVGVNLFDYGNAASVAGAFGTISIFDATYGTLALGSEGALDPGQYFLDYGGVGDTDITLYYNTIPEPGSLVLSGLGLSVLSLLRRRRDGAMRKLP